MKGQFPLYWFDHTTSKYRVPITSSCIRKGLVRQYVHSTYSPGQSTGVKWWTLCLKSNSCSHDLKSPVSCPEETLIEVSLFQQSREHLKHFLSSNHQSLNTLLIPCLCHKTGHSAATQLSLVLQALQSLDCLYPHVESWMKYECCHFLSVSKSSFHLTTNDNICHHNCTLGYI